MAGAVDIEHSLNRPMQYAGQLSQMAKENAAFGNHEEALRLIKEALAYDEKIERDEHGERIAAHDHIILIISLSLSTLVLILLLVMLYLRNKRNRKLAESNATKDKFFSIISHDLKSSAVSQRDALQLLLENSIHWDTASLTKYYQKLLKSANEQVDLLYTLLNWTQVQTGRMSYFPMPFDMVSALQPDIALIKNMAESKDLIFDVQTPGAALVTGDCNMFITVIRNLLTNAVKFTPKDGKISLEIKTNKSGAYIISVVDSGIGMNSEQMQNLFRLARQRPRKGTVGEQGSGLGLIVCNELLQKQGSQLHVESEEGKGSRFWFELH